MKTKSIEVKSGINNEKYRIRFIDSKYDDCDRYCIQGLQVFVRTYVKPCEADVIINNIEYDASDFVDYEFDTEGGEHYYSCSGARAKEKQATSEILKRIGISEDVYNIIADIVTSYVNVAYCDYYDCQY